jgi:hypothetical protein
MKNSKKIILSQNNNPRSQSLLQRDVRKGKTMKRILLLTTLALGILGGTTAQAQAAVRGVGATATTGRGTAVT